MNRTRHNDPNEAPRPTAEPGGEPAEDRTGPEAAAEDDPAPPPEVDEAGECAPGDPADPESRAAALEAELGETKERLLRALADIENLRRRTERELDEARKYAITGFARELLEVADNLGRALQTIPDTARGDIGFVRNLAEGIEMTEKALLAVFERHRIAKVEPVPGEKFDHNRHQAMYEVESEQHAPGSIAQVLQPGYTIAERLLRPAMVGVAKPPSAGSSESAGDDPEERGKHNRRLDTSV